VESWILGPVVFENFFTNYLCYVFFFLLLLLLLLVFCLYFARHFLFSVRAGIGIGIAIEIWMGDLEWNWNWNWNGMGSFCCSLAVGFVSLFGFFLCVLLSEVRSGGEQGVYKEEPL
jgi:hypothetical protein